MGTTMPTDSMDCEYLLACHNKIAFLMWENMHVVQDPKLQGRKPVFHFIIAALSTAGIQAAKMAIVSNTSGTVLCILITNI